MERVLGQNIWIAYDDKSYLLLNKYNLKRSIVTKEELEILNKFYSKVETLSSLSNEAINLFSTLVTRKQIIRQNEVDELYSAYLTKGFDKVIGKKFYKSKDFSIDLSYKCNQSCSYCYQKDFDKKMCFTIAMINQICVFFNKYGVDAADIKYITISGGEPLMATHKNLILHLFGLFPNAKFIIKTNGINLESWISILDLNRIYQIQISFDCLNHYHQKIYKNKHIKHEELIKILRQLNMLGVNIQLNTMYLPGQKEMLLNLLDYFDSSGIFQIAEVAVSYLSNHNVASNIECSPMEFDNYIKDLAFLKKKSLEVGFSLVLPIQIGRISRAFFRKYDPDEKICLHSCVSKIIIPHFAPDGNVYWCANTGRDANIIGDLYNGFNERKIRNLLNRNFENYNSCINCDFFAICNAGCPLYTRTEAVNDKCILKYSIVQDYLSDLINPV